MVSAAAHLTLCFWVVRGTERALAGWFLRSGTQLDTDAVRRIVCRPSSLGHALCDAANRSLVIDGRCRAVAGCGAIWLGLFAADGQLLVRRAGRLGVGRCGRRCLLVVGGTGPRLWPISLSGQVAALCGFGAGDSCRAIYEQARDRDQEHHDAATDRHDRCLEQPAGGASHLAANDPRDDDRIS